MDIVNLRDGRARTRLFRSLLSRLRPIDGEPISTISLLAATILGVVEGLTEFLPVSSTGHLILCAEWLGLDLGDRGVSAFLIVIQAGALLAVVGFYRESVVMMLRGLAGSDPEGLRLAGHLLLAFIPAPIAALLLEDAIKDRLFAPGPVALALGVGGLAMIGAELYRAKRPELQAEPKSLSARTIDVTWKMALIIGLAQCLALWPGTSRSMVTLVAGMLVGLSPRSAAQFSFLLALPTLGAATVYDVLKEGGSILDSAGVGGLFIGFALSCVVAAAAIRFFLHYLTSHGLTLFGVYRIVLALLILLVWKP